MFCGRIASLRVAGASTFAFLPQHRSYPVPQVCRPNPSQCDADHEREMVNVKMKESNDTLSSVFAQLRWSERNSGRRDPDLLQCG